MHQEETYILAIDTATPCSSVALTTGTLADGRVLANMSLSSSVTHSRRLLTSIDWLLREADIAKDQIYGYAVGLGPGSFTGLRIGMATVKGLAAASGKPFYGISTLDIIAASCSDQRLICAVLDARKREVYTAFYRCGQDGFARRVSEIEALPPDALPGRINEPVLLVGDGLKEYGEYYRSVFSENMTMAPASHWSPSAAVLGLLAGEMAKENRPMDVSAATPLYVRASDAELNLKKKQ